MRFKTHLIFFNGNWLIIIKMNFYFSNIFLEIHFKNNIYILLLNAYFSYAPSTFLNTTSFRLNLEVGLTSPILQIMGRGYREVMPFIKVMWLVICTARAWIHTCVTPMCMPQLTTKSFRLSNSQAVQPIENFYITLYLIPKILSPFNFFLNQFFK